MCASVRSGAHSEGGFTIIELMIVMVILGILASIIVLAVNPFQNAATASHSDTIDRECQTATIAAEADATIGGGHTVEDFTNGGCTSP